MSTEMKKLIIGSTEYEIVDESGRSRITALEQGGGSGTGLTQTEKELILELFEKADYTDDASAALNALSAMWSSVSSISAVYTQSGTVYSTDPLNSLKSDLVVTATFKDGSTGIIDAADYTLSGTLAIGTSTITVSYEWKTATFSVTVSEPEHYEYYTVSDADFSTDYSTRLAGLTSEEFAIKIPSHVKSGTITNQLWDCANENTAHITFTDETDFELNRFDTANSDTTKQGALRDITNIPSSVNSMAISAPQITRVSDVSNVTSFTFKYNTAMTNLNGIVGLSDNDNITSLKIQENTGLVDLSDFIIPENVSSLNAMFQGCSALEKARIDYNYTSSILSNSGLMFQRTALKRLDIHASDLQSRTMFSGFTFGNGSVEIRCAPNTNTWTYWKDYMESNSTAFRNTYDGALRFCLHSFSAAQKTITVWGDSLTRGGDGTTYSDLCVKLSNMLTNDCVVQNLGAGGTSAANQAQYFAQYDVGYDDITVLFFGHNTPGTTIETYNESYIPHLSKYVVLGLVTKNYTTALNAQMATEYGAHFLDTHAYMVQNGFTITGLTPTAQDETDISNGDVPHSFLADDYIHLNQYGGQIVATAIKEKLLSLGYITNSWLAS